MRLQIYSNLINQLPIEQQAIEVNLKNWNKYIPKNYKKTFKGIFCNKDLIIRENTIQISRHDLFKEGEKKNIYRFILMTLMWGYPSGMRGKNIPNILGNIKNIKKHLKRIKSMKSIDWDCELIFIDSIKGLGLSTYSKMLYFLKLKVGKYPCLILDDRLIKVIKNKIFKEFDKRELENLKKKDYPKYLEIASNIAKQLRTQPDKIEMFLFVFGNKLKNNGA